MHFVRLEPFSFSVAGQPWISPEWLSEIPYWFGFKWFHFVGIFLVTWLGLSGNLVILYWRTLKKSGNAFISMSTAALALTLMAVNSGPRTIILAYLALQAELAILEAFERGSRRALWCLPPLFCIWVNLHGSWLIGLGLFVLYFACGLPTVNKGLFVQRARNWQDNRALLVAMTASIAILFLNPYGWGLVYNPLDMMLHQSLNIANVQEWQPLNLSWSTGKFVLLSILLMLGANMLRKRDWKLYELGFVLFAWFAAFDHVRFTFLAAVLVTPFLATDLTRVYRRSSTVQNGLKVAIRNSILIVVVVIAIVRSIMPEARLQQGYNKVMPTGLIEMIQPNWRVLNGIELGGVMAMQGKRSFVDTRIDTFEHHGIFGDYLDTVSIRRPLENLAKYRIDHVLVRKETPLTYLLRHTKGWRQIAAQGEGDNAYVLLEHDE
jgi:hypothetical protein